MDNWMDRLETRQTEVGFGLFARDDIRADETLAEIMGRIIDDPDYESDYCIDLGDDAKLEPFAPFSYLNHSCAPNCELVMWKTTSFNGRKYPRLWVDTIRPVARGEELTIDYAWPPQAAIPCLCRSANCRGWIVRVDELPELLERQRTRQPTRS